MPAPNEIFASARDVLDEFQRKELPATFCHVPFSTLILEPDGRVGACRMKGTQFPVGNLNTQTLDEIWNGEKIRDWRRQFLTGPVEFCGKEVRHQRCNTCPEYNSLLGKTEIREFQEKQPLRLALNLNGKCNLECQMCHIWKEPNGLYDTNGWWNQIEPWLDSLQELELLSGEPFVQKDTYRLIERVSKKNPGCLWTITTNGHWKLSETVKLALDKIRFKHLTVSLDSLEPGAYARIRKGGSLNVVLDNLDQLLEYDQTRIGRRMGSLNLHVAFLVQRDNWKEIGKFHDFGLEKGVKVFRIFLYEPSEHSLLTLGQEEREGILEYYVNNLTAEQLAHSRRIFLPLLESLEPIERAHFSLELQKRMSPPQ